MWPLALGMLNNALLQFADRAFLAKDSMASLEAALPASMLAFVVTGFFQSIVAYSGTFVAQYHGAGSVDGVARAYHAGRLIALASGVLAAALVPVGLTIVPAISANPEVVARAKIYYSIIASGAVAVCGQMAAASFFTGQGKTRLVFWVNVAGNVFNVIMDPILIFGLCGAPRLGIAGAGIATVAASLLQWAVLDVCARKEFAKKPRGAASVCCDASLWQLVARVLRFGIPSGAYSVLNILSFTIFVFATGLVGDVEFAVSNACFSVNWLLIAPVEGFAIGASTLVAQAQGKGDSAAARQALRRTLVLALAFVGILSIGAVLLYRPILAMFSPADAAVAEKFYSLGFVLVVLMATWQMFDAADVVVAGALKGAGDTKFVMWWMVAAAFGFWLPQVWLVKIFHNTMPALWGTMVVYVMTICAGEIICWRRGKWQTIKLV